MSYMQHKSGLKKSLWEQEELSTCCSDTTKQTTYARSSHSVANHRPHMNCMGPPRWTDKVKEFYSYNRAVAVDGGCHRGTFMPRSYIEKGFKVGGHVYRYGKIERKKGHKALFGAKKGDHGKRMSSTNPHGGRGSVIGRSASHGYSSCSDSSSESESDYDSD